MAEVSNEQPAEYGGEGFGLEQQQQIDPTMTARSGQGDFNNNNMVDRSRSGRSVDTAMSRDQLHQAEVQHLTDLRPALLNWLGQQDALFQLLEQKSGLEREKIFYGLGAVLALYMVVGPGAGLLCNLIGFAYPAYRSVIAIRSVDKEDDTQWLVYWTTFASFSLLDFFAENICHVFPVYWLVKLLFLLYLALPQTNGAHRMYVNYVDPAFDKLSGPVGDILGRLGLN